MGTVRTLRNKKKETKEISDYKPLPYESKLFQKNDASNLADILEIVIKLSKEINIEEFNKNYPIVISSGNTE